MNTESKEITPDEAAAILESAPAGATHFDSFRERVLAPFMFYKKVERGYEYYSIRAGQWIKSTIADYYPEWYAENLIAISSLEQRPSPCAQCPNVGHKTCCCEVR